MKPHVRGRIKAQRRIEMKGKARGTEDECADEEGRKKLEALHEREDSSLAETLRLLYDKCKKNEWML